MFFPGSTNVDIHDPSQALLLLARTISGLWNLDFGQYIIPPFCENLSTYHALFLDYILGFHPMILIFFTYVLIELHANNVKPVVLAWKPFHKCFAIIRRTWDPRVSIVNAFATFLLLSLSKMLFISNYPDSLFALGSNERTTSNALFYSPKNTVHSHYNIPFIIVGYSIATIFGIIPTFLLCCYQTMFVRKALTF